MSEKENNDGAGTTSENASSEVNETPEKSGRAEAPVPAPAGKSSGGGSSLPGWLALLLVLGVAGGTAWIVNQGMQREQALLERVAELENAAGQERVEAEVAAGVDAVERRLQREMQATDASLQQTLAEYDEELSRIAERLEYQKDLLDGFSANDEDTWLRAEAQYLLRLANQRVLMARDPGSAVALLQSADNILNELSDPGLHEVRAAVATEIAALRALPDVDVEGIYLRLSALVEQAGKLKIFEAPEIDHGAPPERVEDNWQARLRLGYEEAVEKLSQYIVIRRRDVPMQALMDPQWEGLVRQNLRMLLEQSQVALLRGNQRLYRESLERARHWVAQFADSDEAAAGAMDREIVALQQETVAVEMPDLSRSVQALDAAIRQRPQSADAE